MTTLISAQGGVRRRLTAIGGAVAALFLAAFAALMMPAAAHADPTVLEYSADNSTWGDMGEIPALTGELIPGGEATSTFWAKNSTATGGTLQVYLGNWTKNAPDVQAYVRAEINNVAGDVVDLVNDVAEPGTELKSIHLTPGQSAKVMLVVGMPESAGNESQNASINPDFALDFEVDTVLPTTTTTVTGPATATVGTATTLTATVGPAGATGTVQFMDGTTALGAPVAVGTDGTASLPHTFTTAAAHSVTAVYSGDATHATSTSPIFTVTVQAPAPGTTTTVVTGPATANTTAGVELTATVAPAGATGTVQFKDGATNLGGPVALTNGVAKMTQVFETAGAHAITAVYSGDATHAASTSAAHTVTVTATGGGNGSSGSLDTGSLSNLFGS